MNTTSNPVGFASRWLTASRPLFATVTCAPAPSSNSMAICWLISLSSVSRMRAPAHRSMSLSCDGSLRRAPVSDGLANSVTSVSITIDLLTGFTMKPSRFSAPAASFTSSPLKAVTMTTAG